MILLSYTAFYLLACEPAPDTDPTADDSLPDSGIDTGDTASVDTSEDTAADTGEDTGGDTAVDTGEDTAVDTGEDTGEDTADTADTAPEDTAVVAPADRTTAYGSVMIGIAPGTFTMGGGAADPDDVYVDHEVTLTRAFWLGETEITKTQWESAAINVGWVYLYLGDCASTVSDDVCPSNSVTWENVALYANALSTAEGLPSCYLADGSDLDAAYVADPYGCLGYRLPTEAEWEYAARAGEDTTYSGSNTASDVAWTKENAGPAAAVATLASNAWGLHDMSGNVWEWVGDRYEEGYGGYGDGRAAIDPIGPTSGDTRTFRGGGWDYDVSWSQTVSRSGRPSDFSYNSLGFRLARTAP